LSAREPLLSHWPDKALAFTTAIERVARLITLSRAGMAAHFQLTVSGWRMLRLVELSDSAMTLTRVARRLRVTRPSARETATRLCDLGYLTIARSVDDQRARLLCITEAGQECLSEVDAGIHHLMLEMTNDVPAAHLVDAVRVLDRMARRLSTCETVLKRPTRRQATG